MSRQFLRDTGDALFVFNVDSFKFIKTRFKPGAFFSFVYANPVSYSDLGSLHFQLRGKVSNGVYTHEGAWFSKNDDRILPKGLVCFTAIEETVRWCLFGQVEHLRIVNGVQTLRPNDKVLVLSEDLIGYSSGELLKVEEAKVYDFGKSSVAIWNLADLSTPSRIDWKWRTVKAAREVAINRGFVWDGSLFDSTPDAAANIMGAVQMAQLNPSFSITWALKDNSYRTLNASEMIAVGEALGIHIATQHATAANLRSLLHTPNEPAILTW